MSRFRSGSLRNRTAIISLTMTPTDPTGATPAAGARPYESILPTSPPIFMRMPTHHTGSFRYDLIGCPSRPLFWLCAYFCMQSATAMKASAMIEVTTPATYIFGGACAS